MKINNKKHSRKTVAVFLVFLFFLLSNPQKSEAAWVPGIDPIIRTGLELLKNTAYDLVVGTLKKAAINMLNSQVDSLVSGSSSNGSEAFITDWRDYLVSQPENKASVYMNDYLSQTTRGRNTYTGYSTEGFTGPANYMANLASGAKQNIKDSNSTQEVTYEGDPSQMFQGGNFKNMENYLSGINNPWSFNIAAQNAYEKEVTKEKEIVTTKGVAYQGFSGTSPDGGDSITYPGILVKDSLADIANIPNSTLATAKSIPEIITSVITQMLTKSFQQGFSGVQRNVQKNKTDTNTKENSAIERALEGNSPEARFDYSSNR